jgi:biotin transport system substrate-specific component
MLTHIEYEVDISKWNVEGEHPMSQGVLSVRNLIVAAMFAALVAIGGRIAIPLPPVPITLQTLFVMMAGSILGARWGAVSMSIFVLLAAFGAPVLAQGQGGLAALFGPTGGYILSWPVAAFLIGWFTEKRAPRLSVAYLTAVHVIFGVLLVYAAGVTWLSFVTGMGWTAALAAGALPFIPGDLVKTAVAAIVALRVYRAYPMIRKAPVTSQKNQ